MTSVTEGSSGGPQPYYEGAVMMKASADAPIEPGTQDSQAIVTVTFAIAS